jgi:hypothetical protein
LKQFPKAKADDRNPARFVLEGPPIRVIRNRLQHGDPVDYDEKVHRRLVEVCRVHLEKLTLPLIDALVEILKGRGAD